MREECPDCGYGVIKCNINGDRECAHCGFKWKVAPDLPHDAIHHPSHYTSRGNIECVQITELFNFCRGNAIKYIWRAGLKSKDTEIEDLEKAVWYIQREIARLKNESGPAELTPAQIRELRRD